MMPQEKLYREFQQLERKIQLILNENIQLKEKLHHSEYQNQVLNGKIEEQGQHLDNFRNQVKMSKIVNGITTSEGDSAQLKQTLDKYIKEIDKCIAHLAE